MPRSTFNQSSFVSGELSPLVLGRTDLDQYYTGMQQADNVLIVTQGGVKRRAGTQHIDVAQNIPKNQDTDPAPASSVVGVTNPINSTTAVINDLNPATSMTTTEVGIIGTQFNGEFIVAEYDLSGGTQYPVYIQVENCKLTDLAGAPSTTNLLAKLRVECSKDNINWATARAFNCTKDATTFRVRLDTSITEFADVKYVRLIRSGDQNAGTGDNLANLGIQLTDFNCFYNGGLASEVKLFEFSISTTENYLCVLTGGDNLVGVPLGNLAIYTIDTSSPFNVNLVANLAVPYKSNQVSQVRDVQTENVMLLFHPDVPSHRIIRQSLTPLVWSSDTIPWLNVPQYDYNDAQSPIPVDYVIDIAFSNFKEGDNFQIDVESVISKTITFSNNSLTLANNMQINLQDMPIFGTTGIAVAVTGTVTNPTARVTVSGESTKDFVLWSGFATTGDTATPPTIGFQLAQQGSPRKEDVWSANRGYPRMGAFFSGRLWLGGTKSKIQSLFGSRSGSFFDFYTEEGDDDEGIFTTISARRLTEIVDINPDRGLQVFTTGSEFLVKGTTPSDIVISSQTQHGAKNIEVQSIDGATLFVDANGKTLRQYLFSFNEDAYISNDISVLSSQLIDQPKDLGILSGTKSEDANWVFIINQDGTAAILNTLRSQDINGYTKWISGNTNSVYPIKIEAVSVVATELFLVNKREGPLATDTRYSIVKWSFDHLMDESTLITNPNSLQVGPVLDFALYLGANYLVGDTVNVVARGNKLTDRVVKVFGGQEYIDISSAEREFILDNPVAGLIDVEIGFNFNVTVKPMPIATTGARSVNGQNQMRQKKISNINARVYKSAGVFIDGNPVPIREFGTAAVSPLGNNLPIQSGIIENNNGGNGWGIEVAPVITVPDPTPFQLQAIEYYVESS